MRNRYYDPATGQFTQPDPIGIAGGLNSYGFAAGDPVTYADPYGLSADSIYVHGSRLYQWAVGEALKFFARNDPSFRRAYTAISTSSEAHVHFYDQSCRRGYGNCQGMSSSRTAFADVFYDPDGIAFMNSVGHEFLHAAGDLSDVLSTGIEKECGRPDGSGNGCIAYYDNILRDVLGRENVNDEDGERFAQQHGKPMWTKDKPQ
jgi:hypothetical protein